MTYFFNGSVVNLLFYSHITYWEKVTPLRSSATSLPLKSKLSGKFQRLNAIDRSIEILTNSWISKKKSIKMKSFKAFTSRKQRAASRNHLLSKCSKNAVLGRLEMVQCKCFFWHQPESCFWLCCGNMFIYNVKWVEVRKISEVFWAKLF